MAVKVFNLSTCSDVHRLYVNNMNPLDTRNAYVYIHMGLVSEVVMEKAR